LEQSVLGHSVFTQTGATALFTPFMKDWNWAAPASDMIEATLPEPSSGRCSGDANAAGSYGGG
jgi:hypothetical protein